MMVDRVPKRSAYWTVSIVLLHVVYVSSSSSSSVTASSTGCTSMHPPPPPPPPPPPRISRLENKNGTIPMTISSSSSSLTTKIGTKQTFVTNSSTIIQTVKNHTSDDDDKYYNSTEKNNARQYSIRKMEEDNRTNEQKNNVTERNVTEIYENSIDVKKNNTTTIQIQQKQSKKPPPPPPRSSLLSKQGGMQHSTKSQQDCTLDSTSHTLLQSNPTRSHNFIHSTNTSCDPNMPNSLMGQSHVSPIVENASHYSVSTNSSVPTHEVDECTEAVVNTGELETNNHFAGYKLVQRSTYQDDAPVKPFHQNVDLPPTGTNTPHLKVPNTIRQTSDASAVDFVTPLPSGEENDKTLDLASSTPKRDDFINFAARDGAATNRQPSDNNFQATTELKSYHQDVLLPPSGTNAPQSTNPNTVVPKTDAFTINFNSPLPSAVGHGKKIDTTSTAQRNNDFNNFQGTTQVNPYDQNVALPPTGTITRQSTYPNTVVPNGDTFPVVFNSPLPSADENENKSDVTSTAQRSDDFNNIKGATEFKPYHQNVFLPPSRTNILQSAYPNTVVPNGDTFPVDFNSPLPSVDGNENNSDMTSTAQRNNHFNHFQGTTEVKSSHQNLVMPPTGTNTRQSTFPNAVVPNGDTVPVDFNSPLPSAVGNGKRIDVTSTTQRNNDVNNFQGTTEFKSSHQNKVLPPTGRNNRQSTYPNAVVTNADSFPVAFNSPLPSVDGNENNSDMTSTAQRNNHFNNNQGATEFKSFHQNKVLPPTGINTHQSTYPKAGAPNGDTFPVDFNNPLPSAVGNGKKIDVTSTTQGRDAFNNFASRDAAATNQQPFQPRPPLRVLAPVREVQKKSSSSKSGPNTLKNRHSVYPSHSRQVPQTPGNSKMQLMQKAPMYVKDSIGRRPVPNVQKVVVSGRRRSKQYTWKSVWSTIEKGLDDLANIEEAVTNRAQHLYSTASASLVKRKGATLQKKATTKLSTTQHNVPSYSSDKKSRINQPQILHSKQVPKLQTPASTTLSSNQNAAVSNMDDKNSNSPHYKVAKFPSVQPPNQQNYEGKQQISTTETITQFSNPTAQRKIDWTGVLRSDEPSSLILASGGASHPTSAGNTDKKDERLIGSTGNALGASTTSQVQIIDSRQSFQGVANPYKKYTGSTVATRSNNTKIEQDSTRIFWKNARMSLQEQSSTSLKSDMLATTFPDDDDDDPNPFFYRLKKFLPTFSGIASLNPMRRKSLGMSASTLDAWSAADERMEESRRGFLSTFFGRGKKGTAKVRRSRKKNDAQVLSTPINQLIERFQVDGKRVTLLNSVETKDCISIGQQQAILDAATLVCIVGGLRLIPSSVDIPFPRSIDDVIRVCFPRILSTLGNAMDTWAPHFFLTAVLLARIRFSLADRRIKFLLDKVYTVVKTDTQYGVLFLRMLTFANINQRIDHFMQQAATLQVKSTIATSRLLCFIGLMIVALITMTASLLGPCIAVGLISIGQLISLDEWYMRPVQFDAILSGVRDVVVPALGELKDIIVDEVKLIYNQRERLSFQASVTVALLLTAWIPKLERSRRMMSSSSQKDDENDDELQHYKMTNQIWNMGTSSSSRLGLLSVHGQIESVLDRWKTMLPQNHAYANKLSWQSLLRLGCYNIMATIILMLPFIVYAYFPNSVIDSQSNSLLRWNNVVDVGIVFYFLYSLVWTSLRTTVMAGDALQKVNGFITSLIQTIDERKKMLVAQPQDLNLQASLSTNAGLVVKDLWAAHVVRRAWAVRGATFSCQSGEIVVVLGDDGSGRTRLLTVLAEAIVSPPRVAGTAQKVRGSITVSGLDVSRWENEQLKRRVGLVLNDARSQSDLSQLFSGLTLQEILDPFSGQSQLSNDNNNKSVLVSKARSCMVLALQVTGLYSSLLPRLPSKMSTVVTASEEDLSASTAGPRYYLLSPGEWSKLLLARTLVQGFYDNNNCYSMGTTTSVAVNDSLLGSVLLLDDVTLHFSEVEEARLFKDLRQSGAATVITSNRWASGRFADRILVIKDGAIVESGTHIDLLNLGPQQSIYAAKWLTMTNS